MPCSNVPWLCRLKCACVVRSKGFKTLRVMLLHRRLLQLPWHVALVQFPIHTRTILYVIIIESAKSMYGLGEDGKATGGRRRRMRCSWRKWVRGFAFEIDLHQRITSPVPPSSVHTATRTSSRSRSLLRAAVSITTGLGVPPVPPRFHFVGRAANPTGDQVILHPEIKRYKTPQLSY